ncbi:EthD domain-containing protein [Gilliamella sp. wkB108]|uniref:EthD domain-containing protein n=1 Tax=Gilliamella sp. wkB108 TaxID=3120256 RepID=UPI0009BF4406|nr:EthD domain-containing protein [Gilliamella apicola]
MAEIWWKDLEAMQRNRQSTEAIKALNTLVEDEKRFIDHSKSIVWYSTERSIIHNFLS